MEPVIGRLLSIPGGIHFRKLTLTLNFREDLLSIIVLVRECSHSLESLNIACNVRGTSTRYLHYTNNLLLSLDKLGTTPVDLSRAMRLRDMTFWINSLGPEWATIALRTITSNHQDLRQISIYAVHFSNLVKLGVGINIREAEKRTIGQWLELDQLLAQLWELNSTPPKIVCRALSWKEKNVRDLMGRLLPEATVGGTVNLFDA